MPRLWDSLWTANSNPLGVIPTKVTDSRSIWKSRVLCCRNWPAWCFPTKKRQTFPAKLSLHGVLFHHILKRRLGRTLGGSLFLVSWVAQLVFSSWNCEGADETRCGMIVAIVDGVCRFSAFMQGVKKNNLWDLCCCNFTIQFRACSSCMCQASSKSFFCTDKWHVWTSPIVFSLRRRSFLLILRQ